jgi:ABC-2 type transport system permease protein
MSLWRLEWLRLVRTKRWIALVAVYLFFGLVGPFTARYLSEILDLVGGELEGATITLPPPQPVDGLAQFSSNATQVGLIVAVVVAAGALTLDAKPEMGIFLRTRVAEMRTLLWPRYVTSAGAIVGSFLLGALAAWYESVVLIGGLPTGGVLAGIAYGVLYLLFVVAVVAAAAGRARSVLGTVLVSIFVLLLLPIVGIVDAVGDWLPNHLVNALTAIPDGAPAREYLKAAVVTVIAGTAALWLAVRWATAREL